MTDNLSEYLSHRPNIERYMNYMNSSLGDKLKHILPNIEADGIQNPQILSVGSGTGVLENAIAEIIHGSRVLALDASMPMLEAIHPERGQPVIDGNGIVEPIQADAEIIPLKNESVDTIILSSVVHEIASYKHNFEFGEDMKPFFKEIFRVLKKGGRIIIRDFMQAKNPDEELLLQIGEKKEEGEMDPRVFLERFASEFKGDDLSDISSQIETLKNEDMWKPGAKIRLKSSQVLEVAAHYSWSKSFDEEVKEKYGYFSIDSYAKFLEDVGREFSTPPRVIQASTYMQEGYKDHINGRLDLQDQNGQPLSLPNFTGVIVLEK